MSEENKNTFSIKQSPFIDNWWNKFNQETQEKLRKIDKKSRENRLNFSLNLGKEGLGGSGFVFIPNSMPVEERQDLLEGLEVGYVNEITPLDLGEDSEYDETGYEVYYGNPNASTEQNNKYYIPGRGWNQGSATGVYTLHGDNGLHSKNSTSIDESNRPVFPVYTLWGENKNEAYDDDGNYIGNYTSNEGYSGGIPEVGSKTTQTFKVNGKDFPLVVSNDQYSGSYSSLSEIQSKVEFRDVDAPPEKIPMWKALGFNSIDAYVKDAYSNVLAIGDLSYAFPVDPRIEGEYLVDNLWGTNTKREFRVDDPFDFQHILQWLPLGSGQLAQTSDDSAMSETGLINPSGENWKDREITIVKTFKFEGDDGEMYDAYETHPYEITNQIAETILQPLPEAPYEENGNWMYGGEVITEEDATAIKVYITDLKAKREKYFNDGWRLYLPDEKLLLDEAKVYLNTFQNMWGDAKIENIVKEKNIDKLKRSPLEYWNYAMSLGWSDLYEGLGISDVYDVGSKVPYTYGPDNKVFGDLTEDEKNLVLLLRSNWEREKLQTAITSFPEWGGYYLGGSDKYEESNIGAFYIQMQKIMGIWDAQGEDANIPLRWEQLMTANDWGQSMNDFSAMLVPLMATQGRLAYYFPATVASNTAIMGTGGAVFSFFGGVKDLTDPNINKTFNEFLWSRGTDFFIGGAIPIGTGGLTFKGSNAFSRGYNKYLGGNPLGSFRAKQFGANNSKEWSHRITNYLYPTLKFEAQATGLNLTLTMGEFSESLNHNLNNGVYGPDGFISEPTFGQAVAYTAESMFGKESGFGLNLVKQQLFANVIHGAFTFRPRTIKMYEENFYKYNSKTKEYEITSTKLHPFPYKGGPKDYFYNPKTNRYEYIKEKEFKLKDNKITEEVVASETPYYMNERNVKLGPVALRKYYYDYMQHTFKYSEYHYPDLFSLDGTFNFNTHNKWVNEYHKQQSFRKKHLKNIELSLLELEGLTIDGQLVTKDIARALSSNFNQKIYPNINNPNIVKLSEIKNFESSIASYLEAGIQHSYNRYGNWYPGMSHLSLLDYKHFEPNLDGIRFQGNIPKGPTIDPLVSVLKGNPIYKGLDIVFLPEKNIIALDYKGIQYHDPFATKEQYEDQPKLINDKGDATDGKNYGEEIGSNFIEGEDIYILEAEGQNTVAIDGTGQVIFGEGMGKDAIIEDAIVEPLYKLLERVDPELKAEIDILMKAMHQELIRNGISGEKIDYTELFSKAFTYNALGYSEADPELAKWLHLPKDIVDRFGYWITYETGVDINLIKGVSPPEEAPYTDITDILFSDPIDGGEIIYQNESFHINKNTNNDKNHRYITKSESIIEKLNSASLKQRGVINFLKRHGLNDLEINELNLDDLLSQYKPTDSIPKDVLIKWIKDNTFILTEIIRTDPLTVTGEENYEPEYPTETRYDVDSWGESVLEQRGEDGKDDFGQYIGFSKYDAEQLISEEIDYFVGERVDEIETGEDGQFYLGGTMEGSHGEWENGVFANQDMTIEKTTLNESNIAVVGKHDYKVGDKVFNDESEFREWYGDDIEPNFVLKEYEYTDFENPIDPKGSFTDPEGNIIPLTEYQDYKLIGGENYKELLIINPYLEYNEPHFRLGEGTKELLGDYAGGDNAIIGHIRYQDIYIDGKRILNIENLQSKLHQKGAVEGYQSERIPEKDWDFIQRGIEILKFNQVQVSEAVKIELDKILENHKNPDSTPTPSEDLADDLLNHILPNMNKFKDSYDIVKNYVDEGKTLKQIEDIYGLREFDFMVYEFYKDYLDYSPETGVANAPLQDNWEKVHMNRIIQYAIDNGYDGISIINGEQMSKRWNALTYVDKIEYKYKSNMLEKLPESISETITEITPDMIIETDGQVMKVEWKDGHHSPYDVLVGMTHFYINENQEMKTVNFNDKDGHYASNFEWSVPVNTVEDMILNGINHHRRSGKEYDIYFYDKDGRTDHKFMTEKEVIETFGYLGQDIIDGVSHSTVEKKTKPAKIDDNDNGMTTFNVLNDVKKSTYGKNAKFYFEFYDERLPNVANKILSEYDLKMNIEYIGDGGPFQYNKFGEQNIVYFNDKIIDTRKDKPTPTYKIKKHKFKNKKVEKSFNESKITNSIKPNYTEKIIEGTKNFLYLFARKYPEMPRGGKFALANDILRRYEASGDLSNEKGYVYLNEIIGDLNPKQFHNFERAVVMLDIYSDYQNGKPFTYFGFETEEGFLEAYDGIVEMIENDPMLKKAIERRRDIHEIVVNDLIDMGILDGETIGDKKDYFHHQVLMYQQLLNNGSTNLEIPTPGYGKERIGGYDFNTNYLEAEYFYLSSALHDIETIKIINELESGYNIIDQVKADHKLETGSVDGWEKSIPEGYTVWRPDNRSIFYTTQSISEKDLNSFIDGVIANGDMTFDTQTLEGLKEMMSDVFVFGGKRDGLVIPIELANTLKSHFEYQYENKLKTGLTFTFNPVKLWKKWTLFSLPRVLKYNLNNLTGDLDAIVGVNAPITLKFPEAFKIYYDHQNGNGTHDLYWEALEMGVFNGTFVNQEVKEFDAFKDLINEKLEQDPDFLEDLYVNTGIKAYWDLTTGMTAWRENVMRLGAYIYYKGRLENGETLEDIGYGGTRKTHLEGITDIRHIAGVLSRNITGDYGNISAGGQFVRDYIMPFYSFQEINLRRTTNLIENSIRDGNWDEFKSGIFGAGKQGATAMWKFAKVWWWFGVMSTWNNSGDRDEINDKLSDIDKNRLYLITGESEDGNPEWLRFSGSSSEYLTWFGGDEIPMIYEKLYSGEWDWMDVAEHCAKAPIQKSAEMVGPHIKAPIEYIAGVKLWPDIFNIKERTPDQQGFIRIFTEQFGMEWLYDKIDGRPVKKGWWEYVSPVSTLITEVKVNEINYYDVKDQVIEFEKEKYGTDSGLQWNNKSTITKYYKQALRWGFEEEAEKWLNILKAPEDEGGFAMTDEDIETKITNMNPLNYVKGSDIEEFLSTRTPRQLRQLDNAMTYYIETYNPKDMDKSLLYFDYRAKGLNSRIDATRDNYKNHLEANPNANKPPATFTWDELNSLKEMSDQLVLNGNEKYSKKYLNLYTEGFELLFAEDLRMRINKSNEEIKIWEDNDKQGPKPKPLFTEDEMYAFEDKVIILFKDESVSDSLYEKYDKLVVQGMNLLGRFK